MRLLTHFPLLCFVLVLLSIAGLCVAQGGIHLLLVAGALAAISWYVTEGPRGRSLPRWVSNVLFIGITLYALVDLLHPGSDMLRSLSWFALWLTLIKLYERRSPRDHAQLMALSFLLMLIASFQSTELLFGIILTLYAALGLYVLILYQLYAAHEDAKQARQRAMPRGTPVVGSSKPIIGRHPAMHFRALATTIGAAGVILSIAVFVLFPRGLGEQSLFGDLAGPQTRGTTGFADEVNLLQGGRITESRREVMRMQLLDGNHQPIHSPTPLLMKGTVLDQYEGNGRWTRSDPWQHPVSAGASDLRAIPRRPVHAQPSGTAVVDVLRDARTIFTIGLPLALSVNEPQDVIVDPSTGVIEAKRNGPPVRSYRLQFARSPLVYHARVASAVANSSWRAAQRRLANQRIRALAKDILELSGVPAVPPDGAADEEYDPLATDIADRWDWNRRAAQAFVRYLQSPTFTYSLDLSHIVVSDLGFRNLPSDGAAYDPIEHFLLDHRRAHCEYFASALASLCYNAGIESRLVTGYVAVAYDEQREQYVVRELNAHAWTEVRTGENEWRVFDPTPPRVYRELHQPDTGAADRARWLYDRFDLAWNHLVVRYDARTQSQFVERWESPRHAIRNAAARLKHWLSELNRMFLLGPAGYIWMGLMSVVLVLAIIVLAQLLKRTAKLHELLRLRHIRGREYQRMLRQLGFYLDMLTVLDRAQVGKPPWMPPLRFAEDLAHTHPDEAGIVQRIVEQYYRARYGHEPLSHEELRNVRADIRSLAERLGVTV